MLLGQILMQMGVIDEGQLNIALEEQKNTKEFLGLILVRHKWLDEKSLLGALSKQFNIPCISLKDAPIDWKFVSSFSPSLMVDYRCFPVREDEWSVTIAVNNPLDIKALEKADEWIKPRKLKIALATQDELNAAIGRYRQYMRAIIDKFFE